MSFSITPTEDQLITACQTIGNINGCSCHYTAALARRIDKCGKSVLEMTVAELMKLDHEVTERFNHHDSYIYTEKKNEH